MNHMWKSGKCLGKQKILNHIKAINILKAHEIVYYSEELDLYIWGVTHYGTSWDYVLTDIKCNVN